LWAQKIGKPCSIEDARTLHEKYISKNHFLETDFTTSEERDSAMQLRLGFIRSKTAAS